jgi:hypothetical protein
MDLGRLPIRRDVRGFAAAGVRLELFTDLPAVSGMMALMLKRLASGS